MNPTLEQAIQLAGATLILLAFAAAQSGRVGPQSRSYLGLNVSGGAVLAADAAQGRQWGFFLLEGAWAVISVAGLVAGSTVRKNPAGAA